jgi:hypothetical protein
VVINIRVAWKVIKFKRVKSFGITRVEVGSNISTVTLRVVGGDEKGTHDWYITGPPCFWEI